VIIPDAPAALERLADQAFVYRVALVEDVGKMVEQVMTPGIPLGASLNAFGHGRELFGAPRGRELGLVGINTDTLYSWARVDVSSEPVILSVPDAGGRIHARVADLPAQTRSVRPSGLDDAHRQCHTGRPVGVARGSR
jgi:hypothetical protein